MLATRTTPRLARSDNAVQRCVRVTAVKPVSTQGLVAAVAAGSLLLVSFGPDPDTSQQADKHAQEGQQPLTRVFCAS